MERAYPYLMGNLVLPSYDIFRRSSRFKCGRILSKTQWLQSHDVQNLQKRNLRFLLGRAYETVPFYHRMFKERGLLPNDIKEPKDLVKLPILTKEDVRKNFRDIISRDVNCHRLIPCQSGGTGDPVHFYITKDSFSWEVAAEFRAYEWAGYRLGDRCFVFWGSPIDMAKSQATVKTFAQILERRFMADTFVISDEVLTRFAHLLEKHRPRIIRGYASSVYMVAKYLNESNNPRVRPKAVITSAETLYDSMRNEIEEAFDCPVFDFYGTREIGAIAAECEEHCGYHISAENVVTEFVDDDGPVSAGEKGVMLVTDLKNLGMPFIRYRIGDIGVPSNETCACGRGLPLMSSIEGRVSDFMAYYDEARRRIVPVGPLYPVIITAVMHMPVENCQVIQENVNRLTIRLIKGKGYVSEHTDFMLKHIQKYLGDRVKIDVEFVDFIPPLQSGKRSMFLSKIDPFQLPSKAEKS